MTNITAIIHTRNAERYLQSVIDRLKSFDEIIVCDMESTDSTLEIAEQNGCRILHYEYSGCCAEPARDFAMKSATTEWVFFVDADELIPKALCDYLIGIAVNPGKIKGIRIARENRLLNGWNRATYPDYQLRFLHRESSTWPPYVHSFPKVKGKVISMPKKRRDLAMVHIAPEIESVMERMNRYTTGELKRSKGKRPGLFKMVFKPWWRFVKSYIFKGGFKEGVTGYIAAKNDANYQLYKLAKLYEDSLDDN